MREAATEATSRAPLPGAALARPPPGATFNPALARVDWPGKAPADQAPQVWVWVPSQPVPLAVQPPEPVQTPQTGRPRALSHAAASSTCK